jgi:hypothetical protein
LFLPRNIAHEQSLRTDRARELALLAPGRFEGYFRGMAEALNCRAMTPQRIQEIARQPPALPGRAAPRRPDARRV